MFVPLLAAGEQREHRSGGVKTVEDNGETVCGEGGLGMSVCDSAPRRMTKRHRIRRRTAVTVRKEEDGERAAWQVEE